MELRQTIRMEDRMLADDMMYDGQVMLSYTINYPYFTAGGYSTRGLNRINTYYRMKALEFERYCRNVLFREAVEAYQYAKENGYNHLVYEAFADYILTFNDGCTLSLYFDRYLYTGGANGNTERFADTWDVRTGQMLPQSHWFDENFHYEDFVKYDIINQIQRQMLEGSDTYFDDYPSLVRQLYNPENYYLTEDGMMVFFQPYEIAPGSAGVTEFLIPYSVALEQPECDE